jgi:hypothetical protein
MTCTAYCDICATIIKRYAIKGLGGYLLAGDEKLTVTGRLNGGIFFPIVTKP